MSSKTKAIKPRDLGSNLVEKCWADDEEGKVFIKFGDGTWGSCSPSEQEKDKQFYLDDAIAQLVLSYIINTYGDMDYEEFMDSCIEKANAANKYMAKWEKFLDGFYEYLTEEDKEEESEDEEDDVEEETKSEESSNVTDGESKGNESTDEKSDADEELEKKWNTLVDEIEGLLKILEQPKTKRNAASIWETLWR